MTSTATCIVQQFAFGLLVAVRTSQPYFARFFAFYFRSVSIVETIGRAKLFSLGKPAKCLVQHFFEASL